MINSKIVPKKIKNSYWIINWLRWIWSFEISWIFQANLTTFCKRLEKNCCELKYSRQFLASVCCCCCTQPCSALLALSLKYNESLNMPIFWRTIKKSQYEHVFWQKKYVCNAVTRIALLFGFGGWPWLGSGSNMCQAPQNKLNKL